MKINLFFRLHLLAFLFCLPVISRASDVDLINIVAGKLKTTEIRPHLESSAPILPNEKAKRQMKRIDAFGKQFDGQSSFKGDALQSVSLWCKPRLTPEAALQLFSKMSDALGKRFTDGRLIKNVPNYGDASDIKTHVRLWTHGDELIVLKVEVYPNKAEVSLARLNRALWFDEMGADEREFWEKTLNAPITSK